MERPAHCRDVNIGRPVRCCKTLWERRTIGTAVAASWAVTRQTPGTLSIRERETTHLLKGKWSDNGNRVADWVYKWHNSFVAPIPLHVYKKLQDKENVLENLIHPSGVSSYPSSSMIQFMEVTRPRLTHMAEVVVMPRYQCPPYACH